MIIIKEDEYFQKCENGAYKVVDSQGITICKVASIGINPGKYFTEDELELTKIGISDSDLAALTRILKEPRDDWFKRMFENRSKEIFKLRYENKYLKRTQLDVELLGLRYSRLCNLLSKARAKNRRYHQIFKRFNDIIKIMNFKAKYE